MGMRLFGAAAAIALTLSNAASAAEAGGKFLAGAAKVDITPAVTELGPDGSIGDRLFARAIYISNGGACAVIVGLDQGGARTDLVRAAVDRASQQVGCASSNFIISATHTHSGSSGGLTGSPSAAKVADAIVQAVQAAKAQQRPVRIAYGTTPLDMNVNRDVYHPELGWLQGPNPAGHSDKTLAVVSLIGEDDLPVAMMLNYAMHPVNFYLTGVVSPDFAGAASRYVERRFDDKAVAVFTQGASGNQNPLLRGPTFKLIEERSGLEGLGDEHFSAQKPWEVTARRANANQELSSGMSRPVDPKRMTEYRKAIAETKELVAAEGAVMGERSIDVGKNWSSAAATGGTIWGGQVEVSCPGRDRLDNTTRQGVLPPYKDGAPVLLKVGLLRIADMYLVTVNGEVYSEIAAHLKAASPNAKTLMVTLANGGANSGYIYSDAASSNLSFQVIGSRLKPGCAESGIVKAALELMAQAEN
jgi:hypothetical protein